MWGSIPGAPSTTMGSDQGPSGLEAVIMKLIIWAGSSFLGWYTLVVIM